MPNPLYGPKVSKKLEQAKQNASQSASTLQSKNKESSSAASIPKAVSGPATGTTKPKPKFRVSQKDLVEAAGWALMILMVIAVLAIILAMKNSKHSPSAIKAIAKATTVFQKQFSENLIEAKENQLTIASGQQLDYDSWDASRAFEITADNYNQAYAQKVPFYVGSEPAKVYAPLDGLNLVVEDFHTQPNTQINIELKFQQTKQPIALTKFVCQGPKFLGCDDFQKQIQEAIKVDPAKLTSVKGLETAGELFTKDIARSVPQATFIVSNVKNNQSAGVAGVSTINIQATSAAPRVSVDATLASDFGIAKNISIQNFSCAAQTLTVCKSIKSNLESKIKARNVSQPQ